MVLAGVLTQSSYILPERKEKGGKKKKKMIPLVAYIVQTGPYCLLRQCLCSKSRNLDDELLVNKIQCHKNVFLKQPLSCPHCNTDAGSIAPPQQTYAALCVPLPALVVRDHCSSAVQLAASEVWELLLSSLVFTCRNTEVATVEDIKQTQGKPSCLPWVQLEQLLGKDYSSLYA